MSLKPRTPTAPLLPITQQAIWAASFWVLLRGRSLQTGVAIGGRRIVSGVTTIRTRRRTVARITATVIITARLITITIRELMAGKGVLLARTDQRPGGLVTILTRERMHEAVRFPHLTAAEVPHRRTIHTPEPMLRPDKVRARTLNGAAPMCRGETRALPRVITRRPMEQWLVPRLRREEKWLPPVRSGETARLAKLQAAICMLDTMVTFIRTPATAGRN